RCFRAGRAVGRAAGAGVDRGVGRTVVPSAADLALTALGSIDAASSSPGGIDASRAASPSRRIFRTAASQVRFVYDPAEPSPTRSSPRPRVDAAYRAAQSSTSFGSSLSRADSAPAMTPRSPGHLVTRFQLSGPAIRSTARLAYGSSRTLAHPSASGAPPT